MTSRSTHPATDDRRRKAWIGAVVGGAAMVGALLTPVTQAAAQDAPISLIRDTEVEAILHKDADPIFRAAGIDPKAVTIYIVGDEDMNAFVSGGQNLFVFTGLIAKTKTPNQLTGVIAHETGHMAGGHLVRGAEGEKQELATYLLTMGLGVLAAAAGSPDAAAGLLYSSGYFAALTGAGFTRVQEASADQAAITYLEKAGMSGKGIVDFFDNFRYEEVFENARRYKFFQDHPITSERIAALQVRAAQQPHYNVVDTPEAQAEHEVMVAKLKAFENLPAQTLLDYPETDASFPARYARAIAYYRDLQTDRALKLTDALIAEQPNNP
jgi:predicted Zn-dependent protease